MQTKSVRTIGSVIFLLGVFLGLVLALVAIWGDFEGFSYFNAGAGYQPFNGLVCPILMTRSEKSIVTANFNNPGSQEFEPYYEVTVSGSASLPEFEGQLSVPAHTTKSIRWTVDSNDIDLGFFILINMDVLPVAGYSTREDTCGILVLDLSGLTGGQVLALLLAASLLGLVIGLGLWEINANINIDRNANLHRALRTLGIMVLLALLTSIKGWWAVGLIFCILTILLLVIIPRLLIES